MKRNVSIALIGIASLLLLGSVIGSARAALAYYSEDYVAQMDMKSIGISLLENGERISWRDYLHKDDAWNQDSGVLLSKLLGEGETFSFDKQYTEELAVENSGAIDEYVRVTVNKYWETDNSEEDVSHGKRMDLDPSLIQIHFLEENGWVIDKESSTEERTVLYYSNVLKSGQTSPLFADTISIDGKATRVVSEKKTIDPQGYTTIESQYEYDGARFMVQADVDAVQTHNGKEAIKSAWGVDVAVADEGALELKKESVAFDGKKMDSTFSSTKLAATVAKMQPGDQVDFTVHIANESDQATDWYMSNTVLQSLEDAQKVAANGGYTYRLTYCDMSQKETILYDSQQVGGEKGISAWKGLREATDSLDEFFFLRRLNQGENGDVHLTIGLDGESQGNVYQDTLARLKMDFAVEDANKDTFTTRQVKTGDVWTGGALIALVLGLFCVVIGWINQKRRGSVAK